uniref:Rho guanine nucleotide exchange factor 15 n=1 Tax=Knipowitschia caucasica TaxID=637954 RepID=A0AAV2KRZ4_KNICA
MGFHTSALEQWFSAKSHHRSHIWRHLDNIDESNMPKDTPPSARPEIPPKPLAPHSPPLGERGSPARRSGGMVQSIVTKFSKKEPDPTVASNKNTNGTSEPIYRKISRPPSVKPKPGRLSLPLLPPPLPKKRSQFLRKQESVGGNESEPGGKEGGGDVYSELSPCCDPHCACVCHMQRPGMMLTWVPVKKEEYRDDENDFAPHLEPPTVPPRPPIPPRTQIKTSSHPSRGTSPQRITTPPKSPSLPDREQSLRLKEEPLYQTYRDSVITKEIKRQTVCRNISKASVDFTMERGLPGTASKNRSSPVPTAAQSTLWQDLQAVRDSGELEKLSPEQCKYQESMFEVLTSESSYLRSLRVLTEHFMENRDLEETLIIRDRKVLFSNILRIREVSERFLTDLEDRIFEKIVFSDICDIIHYHTQHNFPAYVDYVRNQIFQEQTYTNLIKNNVQFTAVITRLQESPQCQRLPFMSFMLLPFQRITRLKMLIENILRRTKEKTIEEETASKALSSVSKIIDKCNTEVGKMKQTEQLIHISKTLEFEKLKAVPIISPTRCLEKKGELQEMSRGATIFNMRAKFTPVYLFLFNDLLLITVKKSSKRSVVTDYAHRSLVQVQALDEGSSTSAIYENCFNLLLLENNQKRQMERLLKAPTRSDMERWMAAFPSPTKPDEDDNEVVYADWDCPQVQCIEQYVAQQADEISLEPTEIINVVKKGSEGLYQGVRLSDGQRGWFPAENVIEITNEHVRRRNLRERYRVMQAASNLTNTRSRTGN